MSKRNPSRSERFSEVQSAAGEVRDKLDGIVERFSGESLETNPAPFATMVDEVSDELDGIDIGDLGVEVEMLTEELQNWLDNMPENLQGGMKAEELEDAISVLEDVMGDIEEANDNLASAIEGAATLKKKAEQKDDIDHDDINDLLVEPIRSFIDALENVENADVMFPGMF